MQIKCDQLIDQGKVFIGNKTIENELSNGKLRRRSGGGGDII